MMEILEVGFVNYVGYEDFYYLVVFNFNFNDGLYLMYFEC